MPHTLHAKSRHRPAESVGSHTRHCLLRMFFQFTHNLRTTHKRTLTFLLRNNEVTKKQFLDIRQHIIVLVVLLHLSLILLRKPVGQLLSFNLVQHLGIKLIMIDALH